MLDALLAATEHLVITYTGADERTGARRPPAVPLGELLDALDDTATDRRPAEPARDQVLVRHPLQPFDARNVTPGAARPRGPFSFDPAALAGAQRGRRHRRCPSRRSCPRRCRAGAGQRRRPGRSGRAAAATRPGGSCASGWTSRCGSRSDEPSDALPVELDACERWGSATGCCATGWPGRTRTTCRQAEWRRGVLPPGPLGGRHARPGAGRGRARWSTGPRTLRAAGAPHRRRRRRPARRAPAARHRRRRARRPAWSRSATASSAPGTRLRAWIMLVALTAGHPGHAVDGGDGRPWPIRAGRRCAALGPVDAERAGAGAASSSSSCTTRDCASRCRCR